MRRRATPYDRPLLIGIQVLSYLLMLTVLCMIGHWAGTKIGRTMIQAPSWEEALLMEDSELLGLVRNVPLNRLIDEWGDPIHDSNETYMTYHEITWKDANSLDHITLFLDKETQDVQAVSVIYVFEAYVIHSEPENLWGTVSPCSGEDELEYGDLLRINLAGRPAVYIYADLALPVRVYYKGNPHRGESGKLPYIDTVIDINYFDYILEPIQIEGES